ncbi:hypothetical protein CIB48_g5020 [Xylaria polymorpha]|nr:hypothetical protein CIB48_g5020 [Xylaria polymorpha]
MLYWVTRQSGPLGQSKPLGPPLQAPGQIDWLSGGSPGSYLDPAQQDATWDTIGFEDVVGSQTDSVHTCSIVTTYYSAGLQWPTTAIIDRVDGRTHRAAKRAQTSDSLSPE